MIKFLKSLLGQSVPEMPEADKKSIRDYADAYHRGFTTLAASLKVIAIEAHRRNIPIVGVRGNVYQQFMAEVDNPVPDLNLRYTYYQAMINDGN